MKTYESCGKINFNNDIKTVEVRTALPETLENGQYKYIKYYNISNDKHYGILGILIIEGGSNKDLRDSNSPLGKIQVDKNLIKLDDLKPFNNGKDFSKLEKDDIIYFMCFHDEEFYGSEKELKIFQESLPKFPDFGLIEEPKVGNGGVLTFEGCL
ncbi:hypothetical protein SY27_01330 [Flavobacterium sp. 316]|uniref:hypothetical protein n=1 Tax=Flavobacterium sp. 316 TaxID=1603293 RepID=UPI0005DD340A|nr:hypothetical protein [Flavobacterium sp. 316]KIX22510.1 hypothetical protein SY27_01330 [Flavobacterium sp. 316]